ncbi:MAG: carbohydrate-binding protein, partial [Rhodothermales bacterium]
GRLLFADWMRYWARSVAVDDGGRVSDVQPFMEELDDLRIMDLEVASDGRVYVIDWGRKYFGFNMDARILRVDYSEDSRPASMRGESRPSEATGGAPLAAPGVSFVTPENGTVFDWDEPIDYVLSDASAHLESMLLCDSHVHYLDTPASSAGNVAVPTWPVYVGYTIKRNQVAVLDARTDGPDEFSVPGVNRVILQPRRKEAEHVSDYRLAERATIGPVRDVPFAQAVMDVEDGAYLAYAPVNLKGIRALELRVLPELGGRVEVRLDAVDGPLLGSAEVDSSTASRSPAVDPPVVPEGSEPPSTEGWADVRIDIDDPGGVHTLYLVFRAAGDETEPPEGAGAVLMRVDWFDFVNETEATAAYMTGPSRRGPDRVGETRGTVAWISPRPMH